ncbi:MAG UNVERIFIED_CONTAM: hypothetical protein LVQ98_00790 [Rickettsiaceae bacterium]
MAIEELKPSAKSLVSKIALINNQKFSKQVLTIIADNKDTIDDDIYQLSKFALISNIDTNTDNPIYEMHDVITHKILEISGERKTENILEDVITKLINAIPKNVVKSQVFRTADTICENLAIIAQNAQKYYIDDYQLLELNLQLITQYVNIFDLNNAKILVDWFNKNEDEGKYKTWLMNNNEKSIYARYLGMMGWYYWKLLDYGKSIHYYSKSLELCASVKGIDAFKCNAHFGLALVYIELGQTKESAKNIQSMEQMFNKNLVDKSDIGTLFSAKARLYFVGGDYREALSYIDQTIEKYLADGDKPNDLVFSNPYLLRAEILNILEKYQDAHSQLHLLLDMHKLSE